MSSAAVPLNPSLMLHLSPENGNVRKKYLWQSAECLFVTTGQLHLFAKGARPASWGYRDGINPVWSMGPPGALYRPCQPCPPFAAVRREMGCPRALELTTLARAPLGCFCYCFSLVISWLAGRSDDASLFHARTHERYCFICFTSVVFRSRKNHGWKQSKALYSRVGLRIPGLPLNYLANFWWTT